jgi:hypothetical protein
MTWIVVKPLRQSELGWFDACRKAGRETGRQRGLNIDAHVVQALLRPGERTVVEVTARWHDGAAMCTDERAIRKQEKNWRLTGARVTGVRFAEVAVGDPVVMLFERDGDRWWVTWDVATDLPAHQEVRERCVELLEGQSSRLLSAREAGGMLVLLARTMASFQAAGPSGAHQPGLPLQVPSEVPPGGRRTGPRRPEPPAPIAAVTPVTRRELLPPVPHSFIHALRSMGYRFEEAVADLIDNSIQAKAGVVLVRLVVSKDALTRVMIVDDGQGMDTAGLREAIRFGRESPHSLQSLSKFGMGLKLASISQCRSFTVASRVRAGALAARRWTVEGMGRGWECEEPGESELRRSYTWEFSRAPRLQHHGTVVVWDDLDRLPRAGDRSVLQVDELRRSLDLHLSLYFHRFLAGAAHGRALQIGLEVQEAAEAETSQTWWLKPLNPFDYPRSGHKLFPRPYEVRLDGLEPFMVNAHIWPARVDLPEFELDGAPKRAGFYLYRNDRLIVAGSWLGVRQAERASHTLARVEIDVPPELDHLFQLDIKKVHLEPPPGFAAAVLAAVDRGVAPTRSFKAYLDESRAQAKAAPPAEREAGLPWIPGEGFPKVIRASCEEGLDDEGAHRVTFEWAELEEDLFFWVDLDLQTVYLNKRWRKATNGQRKASATDAAITKSTLFLALRDIFGRSRMTTNLKERLAEMNALLVRAARYQDRG